MCSDGKELGSFTPKIGTFKKKKPIYFQQLECDFSVKSHYSLFCDYYISCINKYNVNAAVHCNYNI